MAIQNNNMPVQGSYDARWFVWTIVFLVVTGISLVSYITLSGDGDYDSGVFVSPSKTLSHKTVSK